MVDFTGLRNFVDRGCSSRESLLKREGHKSDSPRASVASESEASSITKANSLEL
jgi:hypothetical protein